MKRAHQQTRPRVDTMREIDEMNLRVSQQTFERALQAVARRIGGALQQDGKIMLPHSPKPDPTYPSALKVLYRKLPCATMGDYEGACVTFDVIPQGLSGDPRRYRSYRSFMGTVENSEELFKSLLQYLYKIVEAVKRHQKI